MDCASEINIIIEIQIIPLFGLTTPSKTALKKLKIAYNSSLSRLMRLP